RTRFSRHQSSNCWCCWLNSVPGSHVLKPSIIAIFCNSWTSSSLRMLTETFLRPYTPNS
ncbi:unnamed protein product, partial [Tenebrio molitor]